jgi:hypothetical protein
VILDRVLLAALFACVGVDIYMGGSWAFLAAVSAFAAGVRLVL